MSSFLKKELYLRGVDVYSNNICKVAIMVAKWLQGVYTLNEINNLGSGWRVRLPPPPPEVNLIEIR